MRTKLFSIVIFFEIIEGSTFIFHFLEYVKSLICRPVDLRNTSVEIKFLNKLNFFITDHKIDYL